MFIFGSVCFCIGVHWFVFAAVKCLRVLRFAASVCCRLFLLTGSGGRRSKLTPGAVSNGPATNQQLLTNNQPIHNQSTHLIQGDEDDDELEHGRAHDDLWAFDLAAPSGAVRAHALLLALALWSASLLCCVRGGGREGAVVERGAFSGC